MVCHVQLLAGDVAVGYCCDFCITFDFESQLVISKEYASAFAIDSYDTEMLKVLSVGMPVVVVGSDDEFNGLASGLQFMTGYHLAILVCYGLQLA